jgi:hypothetical protein
LRFSGWIAVVVMAAAPMALQGDVPREADGQRGAIKREEAAFPVLIDHIRAAAVSGVWQKGGWSDPIVEGAIKEWAEEAAKLTGQARPDLPAGLGGVKAAQANQGKLSGALCLVSGNGPIGFVDKSVILVDGNIKIGFAWDCIIVARGAVYIAHGDRNVVMAGHFIHVSHDGNHKEGQMQGSLLMSGGVVNVSHAKGSVCSAPTMVRISHATGVTFADATNVNAGFLHGGANRDIAGLKLRAAPQRAGNPLQGRLNVVQVAKGNDSGVGAMAVCEDNGVRFEIRPGEQIKDGAGKPIAGLEAWRLSFVGEEFALFSSDREDGGFFVPKK